MAHHKASAIVNAPVDRVFRMWSHFNDYPKFLSHVKEVTYYDEDRSHWVADIVGHHEWDAVRGHWIDKRQIGWRSVDGLQNSGLIAFEPHGDNNTTITISVSYDPPAGFLGDVAEVLGAGNRFETALQEDLNRFATTIAQADPGSLDPMSPDYIFRGDSAALQDPTNAEQSQAQLDENSRRVNSTYVMSSTTAEDAGGLDADDKPAPPESPLP
jgi:ribosome-associated toxin RatA of RatAB toxin-antitoxin module